jgi:hypothetical protein
LFSVDLATICPFSAACSAVPQSPETNPALAADSSQFIIKEEPPTAIQLLSSHRVKHRGIMTKQQPL